jgi:hypothetical protein
VTNATSGPQRAASTLPQLQPRPQSTPNNALQRIPIPLAVPQSVLQRLAQLNQQGMVAQQNLPPPPTSDQAPVIPQSVLQRPAQLNQQGMVAQQSLPPPPTSDQAPVIPQSVLQRLAQLNQETRRLNQQMAAIEQRADAIASETRQLPQNLVYHQQQHAAAQLPSHMMPNAIRNLMAQQQRDRAANGRQGAQDSGGMPNPLGPQPLSGRANPSLHRPDGTMTYTREGIGPNGERWSMTVNETNVILPLGQPHSHRHHHQPGQPLAQHPAVDQLQNILRNADRYTHHPQNAPNHMERAASNPLPVQRVQTPAGSASPAGISTPASTNHSSTVVNLPSGDIPAVPTHTHGFPPIPTSHSDPVVYLLSSPNGPRALLLSNSETFYTPRQPSRRRRQEVAPGQNDPRGPMGLPEFRNRQPGPRRPMIGRHGLEPNNNPLEPANPAGAHAAHANPGAGALAARIGPLIWLIVRLVGFVWFFTAGNPSWSRWLMVSGLAVVVFIVNTGVFNGLFEQLWGPVRRHVEALIPLAAPEAAQIPAINAAIPRAPDAADRQGEAGQGEARREPGRRRGELDPAQVATHLLEQHRQRNAPGWLMTQIRRAEHAMLLFLASLVPGVGERHIAAREAEANAAEAERQRRIDTAAAAESANNETETGEQAITDAAHEQPAAELNDDTLRDEVHRAHESSSREANSSGNDAAGGEGPLI